MSKEIELILYNIKEKYNLKNAQISSYINEDNVREVKLVLNGIIPKLNHEGGIVANFVDCPQLRIGSFDLEQYIRTMGGIAFVFRFEKLDDWKIKMTKEFMEEHPEFQFYSEQNALILQYELDSNKHNMGEYIDRIFESVLSEEIERFLLRLVSASIIFDFLR